MKSITETRLSNRLADLAERAGEAAKRYRRGSIESIQAYLEAGELLAEARGECRRGEWGAVLDRAGIADRTGRLMVQCWRIAKQAGADAERIHDAGGVQAFVAAAVEAAKEALHRAADGLDDGAGEGEGAAEKPALNAGIEGEPGGPPVADGSRVKRDVEDDAAAVRRVLERDRHPHASSPGRDDDALDTPLVEPFSDGLTPAQRKRQAKRDRGECIDCTRPTDGWHVRCPACRERIAAADRRRREDAKLGAVLGMRIRAAARHGRGVRLTAADVAGLVDGERARFREGMAGVRRSPKGRKGADNGISQRRKD